MLYRSQEQQEHLLLLKEPQSMGGDSLHCCYREQVAYALYARFREPKLYRYVLSGDWDLIPTRCRTNPKEASFVHKYAPNDTVLHHLLRFQQNSRPCCQMDDDHDETTSQKQLDEWKLAAVEALIQASPNVAVKHKDSFGNTPLHLACMNISCCSPGSSSSSLSGSSSSLSSDELICIKILSSYQEAAMLQDSIDKRNPLHFLVARNPDISLQVLQALLQAAPSSVHVKDATGDTPIDIVQDRHDEISNAATVLEVLKQAAATSPPPPPTSSPSTTARSASLRSHGDHSL